MSSSTLSEPSNTAPFLQTSQVASHTSRALGTAARAAGWELPVYGGMFCERCANAVKDLSGKSL